MECKIEVSRVVGSNDPITVWNSQALSLKRRQSYQTYQILSEALDELGRRSKTAQGLSAVLTSTQKLLDFPNHRVYLYAQGKEFVGILKVGVKKLFIRQRSGNLAEIEPLCVLDFYVHENYQRHGIGRLLFDAMLAKEERDPALFGYDRPSPKLIGFLRKHFSLAEFVPQTNNFVVFDRYFEVQAGRGATRSNPSSNSSSSLAPRLQQQQQSNGSPQSSGAAAAAPRSGPPPQPTQRSPYEAAASSVREQLRPFDPPRANTNKNNNNNLSQNQQQNQTFLPPASKARGTAADMAHEIQRQQDLLLTQQQQQQFPSAAINDNNNSGRLPPKAFTSSQSYGRHAALGLSVGVASQRESSMQPVPRSSSLAPLPEPAPLVAPPSSSSNNNPIGATVHPLYQAAIRGASSVNGSMAKRSASSGRFF